MSMCAQKIHMEPTQHTVRRHHQTQEKSVWQSPLSLSIHSQLQSALCFRHLLKRRGNQGKGNQGNKSCAAHNAKGWLTWPFLNSP
jgi:hypothetical protein